MSVLAKIREKSGLLLLVIGGALVLFIAGDLLTSNTSVFNRTQTDIGEVAGRRISGQEFEFRVSKAEENYRLNTGQQSIDEGLKDMLRQQTWNQMLNEIIMEAEYNELGLVVSPQELYDMVRGNDPHPSVKQAFTNPETGVFDPNAVLKFLKNMENDESGATKARWVEFESSIKRERLNEKYNNLISKGLYVPTAFAKLDYEAKNRLASIKYVAKRYNTIPDSTIVLTDADLQKYYKEHLYEFEQEASRKIEYVVFDVLPSQEDDQKVLEEISSLKNEFAQSEDDTAFIAANSDLPLNGAKYSKSQLPADMEEPVFANGKGYVHGPYKEGNIYKLAKVIDVQTSSDSVKARHILVKINGTDTASAQAKIDSLKTLIKKGKKFEDLAKEHSEDLGSGSNGGDLGWFTEGTMVKPFNDACFNGKKGDMPVVISQFGIHLIEILDKTAPTQKATLLYLEKQVEPSSKTAQQVYIKASEFVSKANDQESFDKTAEEMGIVKRVAENIKEVDRNIVGMNNSKEIIRWVYNDKTKEGSVSKPFEIDNKFIVAILTEIREKGYATLEQVKTQVELGAKKDKKAEQFINEINAALAAGSLDAIAQKLNVSVETADNVSFAAFAIPGMGREPRVIGTIFATKQGALSKPIKGETGVFLVSPQSFTEPAQVSDYNPYKLQLSGALSNRVNSEVFEALKEKANIIDNRGKFY
ncbi:MAG: SurA N-terminal domain-containing protein [Bacteroidia bacterium]